MRQEIQIEKKASEVVQPKSVEEAREAICTGKTFPAQTCAA